MLSRFVILPEGLRFGSIWDHCFIFETMTWFGFLSFEYKFFFLYFKYQAFSFLMSLADSFCDLDGVRGLSFFCLGEVASFLRLDLDLCYYTVLLCRQQMSPRELSLFMVCRLCIADTVSDPGLSLVARLLLRHKTLCRNH